MKENVKKKKFNQRIFLIFTAVFSLFYIFWRLFFTVPVTYGILSLILGIVLVVCEAVGIFEEYENIVSVYKKVLPKKGELKTEDYPHVDVFIATHNEAPELLYKTVNGCTYMDYPDKTKVHIYICDDANRKEMKELADLLGVGYFGLENNKDAKAGNLNNAIRHTDSKLIVTFDADMIPRRDFLMSTVPYFYGDEEIGFIQTPQSFYNPDLFQYNLYVEDKVPNEQDFFFKEINVGRNSSNAPIYAGSNTVISRKALEEVGGIQTGTVTEDFATGVHIQSKGYRCYAVDDVHANGLSPTDALGLIKQRERWGRGCVQSFKKLNILGQKGLSFSAKVSYISCLIYWWTFLRRYIYIISPIMFAVFGVRLVDCSMSEILLIWLPYFLMNKYVSRIISGNIRTARLSDVIDTVMFPYMIIPVFKETFGIKENKFVVTAKDKSNIENNSKLVYALPHIFLFVFSVIGLMICVKNSLKYETLANWVIMFWLCINIYNLSMAVFFMMGRKDMREFTRFSANVPILLKSGNMQYRAVTKDISEAGVSILLDYPEPIDDDKDIEFYIETEHYKASGKIKLANVVKYKKGWEYRFSITELSGKDKREYFQIVYDREHSFPTKVKSGLSIYSDFYTNIHKRIDGFANSKRTRPRISVDEKYNTDKGCRARIVDFNYEYVLLRCDKTDEKTISIAISEHISMECTYVRNFFMGSKELKLFSVDNIDKLIRNKEFIEIVRKWSENMETSTVSSKKRRTFNNWDEWDDMELLKLAVED